jgi:NADPH:quinone reductase-like Zn-dependent oxidoreductase
MRAVIRESYGPPSKLEVREVDVPEPGPTQVLVKVVACTVNRTDCAVLTGEPFIMRFFTGLRKPKLLSTGTDFAGTIEKVGSEVNY